MTQNEIMAEKKILKKESAESEIGYFSVLVILYCHVAGLYGAYLFFTTARWITLFYTCLMYLVSSCGVVVGAHKLWCHRSFRATRTLELLLMMAHSLAFQFTVHRWVKIHRAHHLHSDTPSDPHDSTRGLFYSHIGWMMMRRPVPISVLESVNMKDIESNPVLKFQKRHAIWLLPTASFIIPSLIPLLWSEDFFTSWHINQFRIIVLLNLSAAVNSFCHTWGHKPYDSSIRACQSWPLSWFTLGEGYHNFHHTFPFDYRGSEKGWTNFMACVVDVCAKVGLAYDLREVGEDTAKLKRENNN